MKRSLFYSVALLFTLFSCHQQQSLKEKQSTLSNGHLDDSLQYTCKEIGWHTYLPKDWNIMTRKQNEAVNQKGKELIEKSSGIKVDASSLKELVNLKKDAFNSFGSTIEPFDEKAEGNYADHNGAVYNIIEQAYKSKNIPYDLKKDSEMVGHIQFYTAEIRIYKQNAKDILMTQKLYNQLINGYDFGMMINYNNPGDKETLLRIVNRSTFSGTE